MQTLVTSWKQLMKHQGLGCLHRSDSVQNRLCAMHQKVETNYKSLTDFVKINIFNFGSYINEDGVFASFKTAISKDTVLRENEFPYTLRDGIHDYIIWCLHPMCKTQVYSIALNALPDAKNIIIHDVNDDGVFSDVWRYHVFWK